MRGIGDEEGVGIVEVFELNAGGHSRLVNISTRAYVGSGDHVLIGGLILQGELPTRVLFRARGPGLVAVAPSLEGHVIQDPVMEIYDAEGRRIDISDDWQTHESVDLIPPGLEPSHPREAALVRSLPPGAYTAIVRGGSPGIGIVEVFELE